jgi:hypothetical protein
MFSSGVDFVQITLAIQRLLDAEALDAEIGAALLAEAIEGRRLLDQGDDEAARRHAERLATMTVALVGSGALDLLDGRAVIQTVGEVLSKEAR